MAKTIRFNLQFGRYEQPIRNIGELMENFNIDLVLDAFQKGLLQRWLQAHNEMGLLEKIKKVPVDIENNFENIELLCKALKPELTSDEIEAAIYPFKFRKNEEKRLFDYKDAKFKKEIIIDDYFEEYTRLLEQMVENSENYQFLKTATAEICGTYKSLFMLNIVDFYNRYVYDYPLVILSLLGNQYARELLSDRIGIKQVYIDINNLDSRMNSFINRWKSNIPQPHLAKCETEEDKNKILGEDILFLGKTEQKTYKILLNDLKLTIPFEYIPIKYLRYPTYVNVIKKTTQLYWEKIKPQGIKCLIIDFRDENKINYITVKEDDEDNKLSASDVKEKFIIMDGLYYKSQNEKAELVYMEL